MNQVFTWINGTELQIDSLLLIFNKTKTDTAQVNILNEIADELRRQDPDSSVFFANQALVKASKIDYRKGIAAALGNLGNVAFDLGELEKAKMKWDSALAISLSIGHAYGIASNYLNLGHLYNYFYEMNSDSCRLLYNMAREIFDSLNNDEGLARCYNGLASSHYFAAEYTESLGYYEKALTRFEKINNMNGLGAAHQNIGLVYVEQGVYLPALDYLHKALYYYEMAGNRMQLANASNSLAMLYLDLYDYENCEKYLNVALNYFEEFKNPIYLSITYDNFAHLYEIQNMDSLALQFYLKSHEMDLKTGNQFYIASSYNNLGRIYFKQGQINKALDNLNLSLEQARSLGGTSLEVTNLLDIAHIYKETGSNYRALQTAEKARILAEQINERIHIQDVTHLLSDLYAEKGNYESAYKYHLKHKEVSDSLLNHENIRKSTAKEYEFQMDKERREQELLRSRTQELHEAELSKQKNTRNFLSIIAIVLLLSTGIVFNNYRIKRKDNEILKEKNNIINQKNILLSEQKQELTELNATKDKFFSIIAHDIKNPLNTMIGFSELLNTRFDDIEADKRKRYIDLINSSGMELYKLLENLLQWSRIQTGKIAPNPKKFFLIDAVAPIMDLSEPTAMKKQITFHNNVDRKIYVYGDYSMITTVVRNLVNNALKFTNENGNIYIETLA